MKKLLTIISVLLIATFGVFVGCGEDKYENMKIEVSSAALSGDVITMGYNNSIEINAKATGVEGINPAVNFSCSDTEALDITGVTNSADGTFATIKANKPTYDNNYFVLKVSSVETDVVFKEIKVKVVLPIKGIDFGNSRLAVSPSNPLNLYEYLNFYPQEPFVTNQKEVLFSIVNYGYNNQASINLDENGNLSVTDDVVDNLSTDVAAGGEPNHLQVKVISKANTSITGLIDITVTRDLTDEDISIESAQLSYNNALLDDKKDLKLFTNSTKYYREEVIVYVTSSQDIDIIPIKEGNGNIVEITQDGAVTKTQIIGTNKYRNKVTFSIRAKSSAGDCSIRFKVVTRNIDNAVSFEFSEDTKINVNTSALPKQISLKQDNANIVENDTISIYNEYINSSGSKIVPVVSSNASTSINVGNKYVRVEITNILTGLDAINEFVLTDVRGNVMDTTAGYIKVFSSGIFYLKALDVAVGNIYKIAFTTIIEDFISYASGGSPSIEAEKVTSEYFISANYGVKEINFDSDTYVIKRKLSSSPEYTNNLITFTVNENADVNGMIAEFDSSMLTVTKIDTFSYLVVGNMLGNTEFRITAKNGCSKKTTIKIVDPIDNPSRDVKLSVDSKITNEIITEVVDNGGVLERVSAKVGGKFNVYTKITPNPTGVVKTTFSTTDESIVSVGNSGEVVTKNAGTVTIKAIIEYYKFVNGVDGYAECTTETTEVSFELRVFTPTTSIGLTTYSAVLYSSDSVGVDYTHLSEVNIFVEISPVTATIFNDPNAIRYSFINNELGALKMDPDLVGKFSATLPEGVNQTTVIVVVTVEEYGTTVDLICTVNIKRAVQVEEIIIANLTKTQGVYLLDMKEDETFNLEIILNPENVLIPDLYIAIYDDTMTPIAQSKIIDINGKSVISKKEILDGDPDNAYIRIFAKDSMFNATEGLVYETIFVTIEKGTIKSPYLIETVDDLQAIKNAPTKHYMLSRDIDINSRAWTPIANFSGSLNGMYYRQVGDEIITRQHTIINLALESIDGEYVGLFANTELTGLVINVDLSIASASITNNPNLKAVGGIVGYHEGLIVNSTVKLGNNFSISASSLVAPGADVSLDIGGMVGTNNGFVYNFVPYFERNEDHVFKRIYTAEKLADESVPNGYEDLVYGKASFLSFSFLYADGAVIATTMEQVSQMISESISQTPVSGRIQVMDSATCPIYVGGIVGRNLKVVNGIYGLYNVQEEASGLTGVDNEENEYLISGLISATINDAGRDFSGTIYTSGRDLANLSSAIGGIVGLNKNAKVYNVSSAGSVSGMRNVGGVVGKTIGISDIKTISSCARISGTHNVGGAIGFAEDATITLAKVENYQESVSGGDILIKGNHNVGGVVGYLQNTTLTYAYAVSFVEESTFTANPSSYTADIYNDGNDIEMFVGGVVGYAGVNSYLQFVYSTMSIYSSTTNTGSFVGGIVGVMTYRTRVSDGYYLGKFIRVPSSNAGVVTGKIDAMGSLNIGAESPIKNFFSHLTQTKVANDAQNYFNTSDTSVVNGVSNDTQLAGFKSAVSTANWDMTTELNKKNGMAYPVIIYTSQVLNRNIYFIKQIPTSVTVELSSAEDNSYVKLESNVLLMTYSANKNLNVYDINDMMTFTWSPASIKSSQLRVSSSATNVIELKDGGRFEVKDVSSLNGIGYATLTFTSVLNLNASCTVEIIVIPRVTSVKLFNDSNLTKDLLEDGYLNIQKGTNQKLFPTFYDTDENGKLVKVDAGYYATYSYKKDGGVNRFFSMDQNSNIIKATYETLKPTETGYSSEKEWYMLSFNTNISVKLPNTLNTKDYNPFAKLANSGRKTIEVKVYTGATDIVIMPNSEIEVSAFVPQRVGIELISDAKTDGVNVTIHDDYGNSFYKRGDVVYINDTPYDITIVANQERVAQILDELGFVLDFNLLRTEFPMSTDNYNAELLLQVKAGKEYMINPVGYTLEFSAQTNAEIVRTLRVNILPQQLLHLDSTYKVLEGTQVSAKGESSFIFESIPKDKIVPGKIGLISIDTNPIYAGVEYFMIEAEAKAMPYINFAQLYKDKSTGASGLSYIFGTNAEVIENGLKLNRKSNYLRTEYTYKNGEVTDSPIEDSNNYDYNIIAVDDIYEFDGNLYVEILTSNSIYEIESFFVYVTAVYADGTRKVFPREFETTYLPALTIESTRSYIALGVRDKDGSQIKDSIKLTPVVDGDYEVSMVISKISSNNTGVAILQDDGTLVLSNNAQAGDVITIRASYSITVEGRTEEVVATKDIMVVNAIIDKVEIDKSVDNKLLFTISSSQQLQATIQGCAEQGVLSRLSTILSRQLTAGNKSIAFWKYKYANGEITNLDNKAISLPFDVDIKLVSTDFGADNGAQGTSDLGGLASISLVGSTVSGSAELMLRAYYYYNDDGELCFAETVDEAANFPTLLEVPFIAQVMVDSTDDLPEPIYTEQDLRTKMAEGGHYILMNDLEITTPHSPITTAIGSFDGNNKIITISNFEYSTTADSIASDAINIGLFGVVGEGTIIKNVIVALPNNKTNPMILNNYNSINFGGIAGINNGIITNCEVISVYDKEAYKSNLGDLYDIISYTYNISTAIQVNDTAVKANIGGLVGTNSDTGVITNSRVGREEVTYISIEADDYNGTNPQDKTYEYTAPVTIMKLDGSGNVGGFVGENQGIISSSYFNNGQMEISSYGSNYTKIGGFAALNSGAIYGSYSAGWEEEGFITKSGETYTWDLAKNPNGNVNYEINIAKANANRKLGGGIYSNGNISGFVYTNTGYVQNCYANISLDGDFTFAANRQNISNNATLTEYGNLNAGGFVFINEEDAKIRTSYTISKIKSNISTHGPFVGVSPFSGDVQNTGDVDKSYYLVESGESTYSASDPAYDITQMSDSELGGEVASLGNEFIIKETFAGFSFANENYYSDMTSGAVWAMKIVSSPFATGDSSQNNYGYPELVSANQVAISVRVLKPNTEASEGDPDYTYIYASGYEKGSKINPQIVATAEEYNKVFDNILGVTVKVENVNVKYTGNMRLVNNIDFINLTPSSTSFEYTSPINGRSVFDGNNLAISNVLISDNSDTNTAFGLFKVLNDVGVKNLTLSIRGVDSTNGVAVGALTGIAAESDINNIDITAAIEGAEVSGQNYVGGLAGIVVSGDDYTMHYINNISSNVSVLASYKGDANSQIIKPGEIWSLIVPPAKFNEYSTDYNLRLQYLKSNVSYAGGIAGVIDLAQAHKSAGEDATLESLDNINARAINVSKLDIFYNPEHVTIVEDNVVSIEAEYAGGLFGFVGGETFVREASFVAYEKDEKHYIMADIAAGGIAAINYGFIDQSSVSFDKETQDSLDAQLEGLVTGAGSITWGNQNLYTGAPTYIGGIAGINIGGAKNDEGNAVKNTGTIQNSYNRVDLINVNATRIGGIAGATHVGSFVNVYTTANLKGNFEQEDSYFGAVIGQLLNNENNRYYEVSLSKDQENKYNLELTNITVATVWNPDYYEDYKKYTDTYGIEYYKTYSIGDEYIDVDGNATGKYVGTDATGINDGDYVIRKHTDLSGNVTYRRVLEKKGRIGVLYGAPTNADKTYVGSITAATLEDYYNPYKWYDHYVNEFSGDNTVLVNKIYKDFKEGSQNEYLDMFVGIQSNNASGDIIDGQTGAVTTTYTSDDFTKGTMREVGSLYYFLNYNPEQYVKNILSREEIVDLYTLEVGAGSNAKDKAFSKSYWSTRIWKFEDNERLISLNFGYIPSIARIYTAEDYIKELNDSPGSKKYYYIMNDIDFGTLTGDKIYDIIILSNFRGTLTGIKQTGSKGDSGVSRYPILYNIPLSDKRIDGGEPLSDTALFVNTTNASFFNLNFVFSSFKEENAPEGDNVIPSVKKTAMLVANANNTTVNNVHIGYRLSQYTAGFLTEGRDGESMLAVDLYEDYAGDSTQYAANIATRDKALVSGGATVEFTGIETYASYFGGIIADGLSSKIRDSSFDIPVTVKYHNNVLPKESEVYFGGIAGKMLGTINTSYVTRNISVDTAGDVTSKIKYLYVGGVVGYVAGDVNNVGYGDPNADSESTTFIKNWNSTASYATSDDSGLFIVGNTSTSAAKLTASDSIYVGGVAGLSTVLIDTTSTLVSAVSSAYNYNTYMYVNVAPGSAADNGLNVGGVIGKNDISTNNLEYRNTHLNNVYSHSAAEVINAKNSESGLLTVVVPNLNYTTNVGGIIGHSSSDAGIDNAYTNVTIYTTSNVDTDSIKLNIGGIVGYTNGTNISNAVNDSYGIKIKTNGGTIKVGGIVGKTYTSANLGLNYVLSTAYIQVEERSTTLLQKMVDAGGLVGNVGSKLTIYNIANIGNIFLDEYCNIGSLHAGGIAGIVSQATVAETGLGAVAACNINYKAIASASTFTIGQLVGSALTDGCNFRALAYYSENLFGLYLNGFGDTICNLNMEDLVSKMSTILLRLDAANSLRVYLSKMTSSPTISYESKLTDNIIYNEDALRVFLTGLEGSKLNPKVLTTAHLAELPTKTYTYYKMTADINTTSTISSLGVGNFIDARGYAIFVNSLGTGDQSTARTFTTISEEAFVVGMLIPNANIVATDATGIFVKDNNGTLLGCGTAGQIVGTQIAGLVWTNTGNVINCFSIANIDLNGPGKSCGILYENTASGNIITSYYTGTMGHTVSYNAGSSYELTGFVNINRGWMANSYTMSNILDGSILKAHATAKTAPMFIDGNNKYVNVYYDKNAYTAKTVSSTIAAYGKTTANLATFGNADRVITVGGNWFSTNERDIFKLFLKAETGDYERDVKVNSSWFNYSYSIANVNGNIPTSVGIVRFLHMLYTGNGKAADGEYTNGFLNGPFRITNAGMIESYFKTANGGSLGDKSYYILQNDISFAAYTEWSEDWNGSVASPIVFTGDFDGNNKVMYNMASSRYGIFRMLGTGANIYDFTITNIHSQTGLIAGGMAPGSTIDNVRIISSSGGGNNGVCSVVNTSVNTLYQSQTVDIFNDKYISGGIVGIMTGGDLKRVYLEGSLTVETPKVSNSYAGGAVGYASGGVIDLSGNNTENYNPFANLSINIESGNAGGLVGYSAISLQNYTLNNKVTVEGNYRVGGFVAYFYANGTGLSLLNLKSNSQTLSSSTTTGGIVAEVNSTSKSNSLVINGCINTSTDVTATSYAGGLAGYANYIMFLNSYVSNIDVVATSYAGGIIAKVDYIEFKDQVLENFNTGSTVTAYIAGGFVGYMKNGIISGTTAKPIKVNATVTSSKKTNSSETEGFAGNVVGKIETSTSITKAGTNIGTKIYNINATASNVASSVENINGGIVGYAKGIANSSIDLYDIKISGTMPAVGYIFGGVVGKAKNNVNIYDITIPSGGITTQISKTYNKLYVGGIVGYAETAISISNVVGGSNMIAFSLTQNVKDIYVGGVAGYSKDTDYSQNKVATSFANNSKTTDSYNYGGIVGELVVGDKTATIESCEVVVGDITLDDGNAGGIVGLVNNALISDCKTIMYGQVSTLGCFGGTIGKSTLVKVKNITVTASGAGKTISALTAGGIVGYGSGFSTEEDTSSYAVTGKISIFGTSYAGGIAGEMYMDTSITSKTEFSSNANVSSNLYAGGLFGALYKANITGVISGSANAEYTKNLVVNGTVSGKYIGYLAGKVDSSHAVSITKISIAASATQTADFNLIPTKSEFYAGGLIGYAVASSNALSITTIKNRKAYSMLGGADVMSLFNTGGVIGYLGKTSGSITASAIYNYADLNMSATTNYGGSVGGVIGKVQGTSLAHIIMSDIVNQGNISAYSDCVGGVVGYGKYFDIVYSVAANTGNINPASTSGNVGGFVGYAEGVILEVDKNLIVAQGSVIAADTTNSLIMGGVVGYADDITIKGIDNNKKFIASTEVRYGSIVGGLIGYVKGTISIKFITSNSDEIKARAQSGSISGGIIGVLQYGDNSLASVENISVATVVNAEARAGGVVGFLSYSLGVSFKNLSVDSTITANSYAGGMVGYSESFSLSIANSKVSGSNITAESYAGGFFGYVSSSEGIASSSCESSGNTITGPNAGGFAGYLITSAADTTSDNIISSNNIGNVGSPTGIGGIYGRLYVSVQYSALEFNVTSNNVLATTLNGFVGVLIGQISAASNETHAFFSSTTLGASNKVKGYYMGAIGYASSASVRSLTVSSTITFPTDCGYSYVGGLIGFMSSSKIYGSSYTGDVSIKYSSGGSGAYLGGIVGYASSSSIDQCKFTGGVTANTYAKSSIVGGIVGHVYSCTLDHDFTYATYLRSGHIVGGIAGSASGTNTFYWTDTHKGNLVASNFTDGRTNAATYVGGIIGYIGSGTTNMDMCYTYGDVVIYGYYDQTNYSYYGSYSPNSSTYVDMFPKAQTESNYNDTNGSFNHGVGGIVGYFGGSGTVSGSRVYATVVESKIYSNNIGRIGFYIHDGGVFDTDRAYAYINVKCGMIFGVRGSSVTATNCRYTSIASKRSKITGGVGGTFYGDDWRLWGFSSWAAISKVAIDEAISSGGSGNKSGISAF